MSLLLTSSLIGGNLAGLNHEIEQPHIGLRVAGDSAVTVTRLSNPRRTVLYLTNSFQACAEGRLMSANAREAAFAGVLSAVSLCAYTPPASSQNSNEGNSDDHRFKGIVAPARSAAGQGWRSL